MTLGWKKTWRVRSRNCAAPSTSSICERVEMKPTLLILALLPWSANQDPTDVPKRHVQEVSVGRAEYRIVQGGTMDGRNCRSPQGVWTPFEQSWESNRAVRMENVGESDVINPWLSNGFNDVRSIPQIVAQAIEPGHDQERTGNGDLVAANPASLSLLTATTPNCTIPSRSSTSTGTTPAENDSICLAGLWHHAGFKVAPARPVGHCVTQVYYDNGWHLFDGDMHSMYLLRDNETIAGEQDLVRDHDLIRRTHTQGILRPIGEMGDQWESSIYVFEGETSGDRNAARRHDHEHDAPPRRGPRLAVGSPRSRQVSRPARSPIQRPDLQWDLGVSAQTSRKTHGEEGPIPSQGIVSRSDGLAAESGKTGTIVWIIRVPYVLVGGKIEAVGNAAKFEFSSDGTNWKPVENSLDEFFPATGKALYQYQLRCQLTGDARLKSLDILNDLQMAPLSLPEMGIGENHFVYSDQSGGDRKVRITHDWVERSASRPPAAPEAPVSPRDGGEAEGTDVVFEWQPAVDPDGDGIADYHFELSDEAGHEVAALNEFCQVDLAHAGCRLPAIRAVRRRESSIPTDNTTGMFELRTTEGSGVHGARPGASLRAAQQRRQMSD